MIRELLDMSFCRGSKGKHLKPGATETIKCSTNPVKHTIYKIDLIKKIGFSEPASKKIIKMRMMKIPKASANQINEYIPPLMYPKGNLDIPCIGKDSFSK